MIAKTELAKPKTKPDAKPDSKPLPDPREQMLLEAEGAFKSAAMSPDAGKGLFNLERVMGNMANRDGGSHSIQFQKDIATLNARMEPDKSLVRVLPLMKIVGLDSQNHVQMFDQADGKIEKLVVASDGILGPAAPLDASVHHKLYATVDGKHGWKQAIHPEYIEQARLGDCYFLSGIQAVADKNPRALKNMIHDNGAQSDGSHTYTVRFPGAKDKPITVNEPSLYEVTAFAQDSGGLWASVVEKAHRKLTSRMLIDNGDTTTARNGFGLLTESIPKNVDIKHSKIESTLTSINQKNLMAVASTRGPGGVVTDSFKNRVEVVGSHMYSVLSYDEKHHTVTVGNPWGENRAKVAGAPDSRHPRIHTKFDAVFTSDLAEPKNVVRNGARLTIQLDDFKKIFNYMAVSEVPKR